MFLFELFCRFLRGWMPLRKQLLEVALSSGLNQKADPRSLVQSGAAIMINCVALKDGAIRKRAGNLALSKTVVTAGVVTTLAACSGGGSLGGAPWTTGNGSIFTYSDAGAQWTQVDLLPEAVAQDRIPIDTGATSVLDSDIAVVNGFVHVAYSTGLGIWMMVLDPVTGATVATPAFITAQGAAPRLVALGASVALVWSGSSAIQAAVFPAGSTTASVGISSIISIGGGIGQAFDAVPIAGDLSRFVVTVETPSGTVNVLTVSNALAVLVTRTVALSGGANTVFSFGARATNAETIWVAVTPKTPTPKYEVVVFALNDDGTLSVRGTQTAIYTFPDASSAGRVGVERIDATHACVVWSSNGGQLTPSIGAAWTMVQNVVITAGAIATNAASYYTGGVILQSRPALVGSSAYAFVAVPSSLQGTTYLAAIDAYNNGPKTFRSGPYANNALRPVGTVSPRLSKSVAIGTSTVATNFVNLQSSGIWGSVGYSSTNPAVNSMYLYPFNFAVTSYPYGEMYCDEVISAGVPQAFDGNNAFTAGFEFYPEISASTVGSGGHLSAGQYQYTVIYSMIDSRGQVHRSSNGNVVTLTAVNNDSATLVIPILGFTDRRVKGAGLTFQSQVFAEVYRTTVGGSVFYKVADAAFPNNPNSATVSGTQNTFTFTDTASDASINTNALLYTTGGVLQNFNPPSARVALAHRNRFWLAGCDDATQLWASKELTPGEFPGFNEALLFNASGSIRALASLDDKLAVFVQRGNAYGIEFLTGDGPNDEGGASDWPSSLQPIPSDTGAVDQRSVATGPFGVIFRGTTGGPQGSGGVFLLSRDLQVQYLSGPVEDLIATYPVCTSMVVHPTNGRVYATFQNTAGTFGIRLVWDYTHGGVWSQDTIFDADTSNAQVPVAAAWTANTATQSIAYHWATSGGRVYRETTGNPAMLNSMTDAGTFVPMTFASSWLKPAMNGFARFWRVLFQGDVLDSAFNFNMSLNFDYSTAYTESPPTITAASIAAFPFLPVFDLQMVPGNQKARAIRVVVSDSAPTGGPTINSGAGLSFASITLEMGVKEGRYQNIPIAQRK